MNILLLIIGGAIGALSRYALTDFVHRYLDNSFPYGTLAVNLLGCLLIGILGAISVNWTMPQEYRIFLFIGVLGSFTTFSTYSLETLSLLIDGKYQSALINVLLNNVLGLLFVFGSFIITREIINR